jgi:hypothetical protein
MDHGMDPGLDLDAIIRYDRLTNDLHADFLDRLALKVRLTSPSWTFDLGNWSQTWPGSQDNIYGFLGLGGNDHDINNHHDSI